MTPTAGLGLVLLSAAYAATAAPPTSTAVAPRIAMPVRQPGPPLEAAGRPGAALQTPVLPFLQGRPALWARALLGLGSGGSLAALGNRCGCEGRLSGAVYCRCCWTRPVGRVSYLPRPHPRVCRVSVS